jgi:hypothetical protein
MIEHDEHNKTFDKTSKQIKNINFIDLFAELVLFR